ncbi:MAG: PilZ domain-containing protein [Pseudomonadota bacterium]
MEGNPSRAPEVVEGLDDFVRALRFPEPTLLDLALFLSAVLLVALAIWAAWRITRRRRSPPPVGAPDDPKQRRADYRVPTHLEAEILPQGSPLSFPAWICDLSTGGATLILEKIPPPEGRLRIRFAAAEGALDLDAEAVRSEPAHGSRRSYLHCRFVDPTPEQEQRIHRIVTAREREILRG